MNEWKLWTIQLEIGHSVGPESHFDRTPWPSTLLLTRALYMTMNFWRISFPIRFMQWWPQLNPFSSTVRKGISSSVPTGCSLCRNKLISLNSRLIKGRRTCPNIFLEYDKWTPGFYSAWRTLHETPLWFSYNSLPVYLRPDKLKRIWLISSQVWKSLMHLCQFILLTRWLICFKLE